MFFINGKGSDDGYQYFEQIKAVVLTAEMPQDT
jgi:hypothetical protein